MSDTIRISEFRIEDIPRSCTFIAVGAPGSGKSTFFEDVCYQLKHRYPVARVFVGNPGGYKRACEIFPPLYVSSSYDEEKERSHIARQKTCVEENPEKYPGNAAINIIDDAGDDPKVYKTKVMLGLFKIGSQHWDELLLIGLQYAIDMPPPIRKSVSYVAIFAEAEEPERKKLYNNFGGLAGSYETFCALMDQITGDYTCLIIKKRTQSNRIEDNIFYYKAKLRGDWKFGCKEYWEWNNMRYNKDFTNTIKI